MTNFEVQESGILILYTREQERDVNMENSVLAIKTSVLRSQSIPNILRF